MVVQDKIRNITTLKRIIKVNSIAKTEHTTDKYNTKLNKQLKEEKIKEIRKRAISKLHPFVANLYYTLENNQENEEININHHNLHCLEVKK